MLCKDVEIVVEQEGLAPLPEAAQAHVATCSHCQGFVADLRPLFLPRKNCPPKSSRPLACGFPSRLNLNSRELSRRPSFLPAVTARLRGMASTICSVAALWQLQLWAF
jgi:hypothetical protein